MILKEKITKTNESVIHITQNPDHVRTAASNVAKSLPPPPIL